jgi:hypothetical protein
MLRDNPILSNYFDSYAALGMREKERCLKLFVFSDENPREELKFFSQGKDKKKEKSTIPKRVSVDPLYESTDKYRRVVKPIKVDELMLPGSSSS